MVHGWFLVENALSDKTWGIRKFENGLDNIWNDGNARENEKIQKDVNNGMECNILMTSLPVEFFVIL